MGNIASGSTGTAITSAVTGGATAATGTTIASPTSVAFQISGGGLTSPVTLNLGSGSTTEGTAVTDIASQVADSVALQAAGITVSGGTGNAALVFTNAQGNQMNVEVTGDTANALGFGSFAAGATPTSAEYSSITGTGFVNTTATGTAQLQFSFNGGASTGNTIAGGINLAGGDATAATATGTVTTNATDVHGDALTISIDGATATSYTLAVGDTTIAQAAADINGSTLNTLVTASIASTGALVLTAVGKGGHSLTVGGSAATALGINGTTTGTSRSAQSIADAINTGIAANTSLQAAGLQATVSSGQLVIASTNGTDFRVSTAGSTAVPGAPSPSSGANIGFGVSAASGYAGATVGADAATFGDAGGVSNTGALTFGPMQFGSDTQAITVSANSADGTLESKTITLQNDATAQTGQSVDSAIKYINQELQQTNDPTLQAIVAVKEDVGGVQKINFLSSNTSFSVSAGSSPNGNGFSGAGVAGATVASTTLGSGTTVSIDTQQNAVQAVTALANAVNLLGSSQAAVGTGENQLNYAIGLAQSQITNFSAAESRIRDADVAADAANLTKAQTLQQAGVAALAQANTEAQSLLHLLQ
jgi:flagellin